MLLLIHGFVLVMGYGFGHQRLFGLADVFNLGKEHSVPTLFATLLLLINALLFFLLYRAGDESRYFERVWLILFLVFCFTAVDEYAVIHERLITPLRETFSLEGYLYFAWIIPYAIGVGLLGLFVAPALWRLGWRYRLLFGVAAGTFLGGAIGVEMFGGRYYESVNEQADLHYRLLQTVEECLEYAGAIILAYTLLDLLRTRLGGITLRFG